MLVISDALSFANNTCATSSASFICKLLEHAKQCVLHYPLHHCVTGMLYLCHALRLLIVWRCMHVVECMREGKVCSHTQLHISA